MSIKMVALRNGAEEAEPLVAVTMMALRSIMIEDPILFYEFVQVCRNRNHKPFGNAVEKLKGLSLTQDDGSIHGSIRNIVLSAVEGDGLETTVGNPIPAQVLDVLGALDAVKDGEGVRDE